MKKQLYLLYFLIFLFSCKKESHNQNGVFQPNELTVAEARNHVRTSLPTNRIALTIKRQKIKDSTNIVINWTAASKNTSSEYSYVEVPLTAEVTDLNIYASDLYSENDNATRAAYSYSTLLVYKDSSNSNAKSNMVTYLPDIDYIKSHDRPISKNRISDLSPDFSGYIEYKDLNGDPKQLFRIDAGKITSTKSISETTPNQIKTTSENSRSLATAASSCQTVCIPVFQTVCTGPGGGQGPRDKDQICTTRQIGFNCNTICSGGPVGPPPGGGGGGDTGGGGTGGSSNPDIKNKATDPCLKKTVDNILNNQDIEGTMKDILDNLQSNHDVDLTVSEGETTNGRSAQMVNGSLKTYTNPNHEVTRRQFSAEIKITESALSTMSKEGLAALLVHELLHGYLSYNNINFKNETAQHSYIATNYLNSLSSFLQNKYNIPSSDAMALSWAGITEIDLYQNASSFKMPDGSTISKRDMEEKSANYMGGKDKPNSGTPLCN